MKDNQDLPISFIVLYQPTITFSLSEQNYSVYHTIKPAISIKKVGTKGIVLPAIEFFLGYTGIDTPKKTLFVDNREFEELKDKYFYQKGEIYEWKKVMPDGSFGGKIGTIAPGIRLNAVIPLKKKGKILVTQLNTFENEHLEIT